jgi:hypothetical protein
MCLNSEKNDEYTDSEKEDTEKSSESEAGTNGETYIDVESLDESGEGRGWDIYSYEIFENVFVVENDDAWRLLNLLHLLL